MRFSKQLAVTVALAVPFASAYSLADLPSCALNAASSDISNTGCATTDYHCLCSASAFLAALQGKIATACDESDLEKTLTLAQDVCSSVGITISASTPPTSSSTSFASPVNDYASATSTLPDTSMTSSTSSSMTASSTSDAAAVTTPTILNNPTSSNHSANTTIATKAPIAFEGNAASHGVMRWTGAGAALLVGVVGAWAVL